MSSGKFAPMDWKERIKTINTSNLSKKSKAPQKLRGLFSLLKNRVQQPPKGGDTDTASMAAERLPMDDRLNVSSESKKIIIKTKVKIKEEDSSSAERSKTKPSDIQLEENHVEIAPKNKHEERSVREDQSSRDQASEEPFVFM